MEMQTTEKAKILRELLDEIDSAVIECRRIAGDEISHEDWSWVRGIRDQLFGSYSPTMYRTITALEASESEAA